MADELKRTIVSSRTAHSSTLVVGALVSGEKVRKSRFWIVVEALLAFSITSLEH